jgi:transcriptional regulator with XRE-family HTH domain
MIATPKFNWNAWVLEAKRRRVQEGLTQLEHANLANVSRTTIASFDRFETSLSIEKALDILRVVGLADEGGGGGSANQAQFELDALERWRKLTQKLPDGDPATFPDGHYLLSYELIGEIDAGLRNAPPKWLELLRRVQPVSTWPPFNVFKKEALQPVVVEDTLECWLGSASARQDKVFEDAPHLDFWRVSPAGRALILRAYQEDGADSGEPGTFLDIGLPVCRAGDIIDHALLLSAEIGKRKLGFVTRVRFNAWWTGLAGRQFVDWAVPTIRSIGFRLYRCALPEIRNTGEWDEAELRNDPANALRTLVKPLYDAFGVKDSEQIDDLINYRKQKQARRLYQ